MHPGDMVFLLGRHTGLPLLCRCFYSSVTALRLCHLLYKQRRT